MTLRIVWSIIFAAFVVMSFGLNFSNIFPPTWKASSWDSLDGSVLWSFGIISVCPFEIGFMSRIAIESSFSAIFIEGDLSSSIEQNMQEESSSRCVNSFFLIKSSISSFFISSICFLICALFSSGKLSNCFRSCSLTSFACLSSIAIC